MKKRILLAILFASCKTQIVTNYKITLNNRSYYTDSFEVKNDSILFSEAGRGSYSIPYSGAIIQGKKHSVQVTAKN
jgi:hypothetical protein